MSNAMSKSEVNRRYRQRHLSRLRQYDENRRYKESYVFRVTHRAIVRRCNGTGPKQYPVEGMPPLSFEQFIAWCTVPENLQQFRALHKEYIDSGFDRKLAPSIDRIDCTKGYTVENIQWMTVSQNAKKYHRDRQNASKSGAAV